MKDFLNEILEICAGEFDVTVPDVLSHSRRQELVYCRKAFCIIVKDRFAPKNEIIGNIIHRKENDVRYFLASQPLDKYYLFILAAIRSKIAVKFTAIS